MTSHRSTTIAKLALPLFPGTALFAATPALAQPVGGGDPPPPANTAPVAVLKASPTIAITGWLPVVQAKTLTIGGIVKTDFGGGDTVKFDGSASHDNDEGDSVAKYYWDLDGDGTYETIGGPSEAKQEKKYYTHGTYHVKLLVKDQEGQASAVKTQDIIVHDAPNAVLTADIAKPLVGQEVKFDAGTSTTDPGLEKVVWDLDGDGTFETDTGTSLNAHASYATPGKRTVQVKITDTYDVTSVDTVALQVNQLPTAAFDVPSNPITGQAVKFDASGSGDDAAIADYAWDLDGDGTFETDTGATPAASKTYAAPATVNVRLRVTDDLGASSVVTHAVQIAAAPVGTGGKGGATGGSGSTGGGSSTGGTGGGSSTAGTGGTFQTDKTAPLLKFASKKIKLASSGKVTIKLTCPATESTCTGKIKLRTTGKRPASLGSASFTLKAGKSGSLKITVPAAKRTAIRRARHLKANAVITVRDAAGNTGVTTTGILIGL